MERLRAFLFVGVRAAVEVVEVGVGLLARGVAVRGGILDVDLDVEAREEAEEEAAVERVAAAEEVVAEVAGVLCLTHTTHSTQVPHSTELAYPRKAKTTTQFQKKKKKKNSSKEKEKKRKRRKSPL